MPATRIYRDAEGRLHVERFPLWRRIEHGVAIITFMLLVLTGFPQKLYEASWAAPLLSLFGGLDNARTIHRITGIVFSLLLVAHIAVFVIGAMTKRLRLTLLPAPQDLKDAFQNLRYYFGLTERQPKLPKFDYRQKFEYVGMVLGSLIMVGSGIVLMWPVDFGSLLGGVWIAASRIAHSNEAVLALLVLVVWHIYSAIFSPDVFPLDKSMFTGTMPVEELEERHRLEYDYLFPDGHENVGDADVAPGPKRQG